MEPLLSVVIPTRNRRAMALQSARSALAPLPFPHEVILSDNASDDDTATLARELPGLRFVRRPTLIPMAEHWNLCVREARGKYVKVLCDDDWLLPGALKREVAALESNAQLAAVTAARTEVNSAGETRRGPAEAVELGGQALWWRLFVHENVLGPPSSVTFRKAFFAGFPPGYEYAADFAGWVLLARRGPVRFLPEPGAMIRLHEANLTLRHVESGTDFLEVQALRRECAAQLTGLRGLVAVPLFTGIWLYRFARRLARYAIGNRQRELGRFLRRVGTYRRPPLSQ